MLYRTKAEKKAAIKADLNKISAKQIVSTSKGESRDNTARFKLVGGKYHDNMVRLTAPFDRLEFPDGTAYEIHPPLSKRSDKWVYVHTTERETNG
jgi:hypothetical protein